jgi:hypothetical protein
MQSYTLLKNKERIDLSFLPREFDKCFPGHKSSASPLLMWIDAEVEWFSDKVNTGI